MKQVESFKCTSKYVPHSHLDPRDPPETCWKHSQKRSQSSPVGRNSKNPESMTSYHSSSTSYKPQRGHVCSSHEPYSKYTSIHGAEASHLQTHKPNKDKHYSPNFASLRKIHYDDELGNMEKLKFIGEDLGNFTEDNVEEDVQGEVTEDDHEEAGEFFNKDYEEHEADDEIDDESDATPRTVRPQRGNKSEALARQQRWRAVEQPDSRRPRCQQRVTIVPNHSSPTRCYHNVAEHEQPEPLSEEDFVRASLKSPTRRKAADYRQWSSSRNEANRYDDVTPPIQTTRRARTKPDVDRLMESEITRTRRCNRCGSLSNKKSEMPAKIGCRFDDRTNIPIKGPIGDEPSSHEQAFCGRCNFWYSTKDTSGIIDVPSPLYCTKPRRTRDVKSATIYEVPEQSQDKVTNEYTRSSSRYQRKEVFPEKFPEKSKRSLHTSHATARVSPRYVE